MDTQSHTPSPSQEEPYIPPEGPGPPLCRHWRCRQPLSLLEEAGVHPLGNSRRGRERSQAPHLEQGPGSGGARARSRESLQLSAKACAWPWSLLWCLAKEQSAWGGGSDPGIWLCENASENSARSDPGPCDGRSRRIFVCRWEGLALGAGRVGRAMGPGVTCSDPGPDHNHSAWREFLDLGLMFVQETFTLQVGGRGWRWT